MRESTRASYEERVRRVVAYLEERWREAPSLETLASVAAVSPFHFYRLYRAVTGETPAGTLRRPRLVHSLSRLRRSSQRITDNRLDVGFESPQSLARAVRAATGHSPTDLRRRPEALEAALASLSSPRFGPDSSRPRLEVRVDTVAPFRVAMRPTGEAPRNCAWPFDLYSTASRQRESGRQSDRWHAG